MTILNQTPTSRSSASALRGWIRAGLLLGLGGYFVYLIATGSLTNYINERFAWLSYAAAALFLLLGVFNALDLLRPAPAALGGHADTSWAVIAIIAIPLLLGTLIPSRPLGVDAITGTVRTTTGVGASPNFATFMRPPLERNILDWLRAFNAAADYAEFNGQPADVIGFVYTEPSFDAGYFMAARFTVSCCVADASAIGLPVYSPETDLPPGEWVRVQGAFQLGAFRGEMLPILIASAVDVVPQPDHPYLYP
jgi:uncharacterized repeat protein (TIGR03943 family)